MKLTIQFLKQFIKKNIRLIKYTSIGIGVLGGIATFISSTIHIHSYWLDKTQTNYSGKWTIVFHVKKSDFSTYIGMQAKWVINIIQLNNSLIGTGEKIFINSQKIQYPDRTSMNLEGQISEEKFTITYIESGKLRETRGILHGRFKGDSLIGVFSSTSADSEGKIIGYKILIK